MSAGRAEAGAGRGPNETRGTDAAAGPNADPADITDLKRRLRHEALARRKAIAPADRARKGAAVCAELLERTHLLAEALGRPPVVAGYVPMGSELDVRPFMRAARRSGATVCLPCVLPREVAGQTMRMRLAAGRMPPGACGFGGAAGAGESAVAIGSPGLGAPAGAFLPAGFLIRPLDALADDERADEYPVVSPEALDLVVVPLVGFDAAGRRLGHGHGDYDRYLSQLVLPAESGPLGPVRTGEDEGGAGRHTGTRIRFRCAVVGAAFAEQELPAIPSGPHDLALPRVVSA